MICEECNNQGYTLQPDYYHDVMMRVNCVECMSHEKMKQELRVKLTMVLMDLSMNRMARLLSDTLISLVDADDNPDFERLFALVGAKNKESLVSLLQVMV